MSSFGWRMQVSGDVISMDKRDLYDSILSCWLSIFFLEIRVPLSYGSCCCKIGSVVLMRTDLAALLFRLSHVCIILLRDLVECCEVFFVVRLSKGLFSFFVPILVVECGNSRALSIRREALTYPHITPTAAEPQIEASTENTTQLTCPQQILDYKAH